MHGVRTEMTYPCAECVKCLSCCICGHEAGLSPVHTLSSIWTLQGRTSKISRMQRSLMMVAIKAPAQAQRCQVGSQGLQEIQAKRQT